MASGATLKAAGLNISPNLLELPAGSLIEAKNVIIRRDDVIESRRGFALWGEELPDQAQRVKQLLVYKQKIIRHYSNKLQFQNGTNNDGTVNFTTFSGDYLEAALNLRLKSIEANGNLYLTTNTGIKKISAFSGDQITSTSIGPAGVPKAIDLQANLITVLGDQESFFTQNSVVAYRVLWGKKDANNNLLLGSPSESVQIYNPLTQLMIRDFNNLLNRLDILKDNGSMIDDGNYASTLALGYTDTATELLDALTNDDSGLFGKLDKDILYAGVGGALTINSINYDNSNTLSVGFSGSPVLTNYLSEGKNLKLDGFTNVGGLPINSNYSVITLSPSLTFTIEAPEVQIKQVTVSAGVATVTTATDHGLPIIGTVYPYTPAVVGDLKVNIQGVAGSNVNGIVDVTEVTNTTQFKINTLSPLAGTTGTLKIYKVSYIGFGAAKIESNQYRSIPSPLAIDEPGTQAQLLSLQAALNECISRLQQEQSSVIPVVARNSFIDDLTETTTSSVRLQFSIPDGIDSTYFYQIYRTGVTTPPDTETLSSFNAGDEMALVYEAFPTANELNVTKSVTIVDNTPDLFRGANLYTNPTTGEGILQANDQPPFAKDINTFKNSVFYANTKTKQRYSLSLIGVEQMIQNYNSSDKPDIVITDGIITNKYEFALGQKEKTRITIDYSTLQSAASAASYFTLNSTNDETEYYIWYQKGSATDPSLTIPALASKTGIKITVTGSDTSITVATKTISALAPYVQDFSVVKSADCTISVSSPNPVVITSTNHGLVNGQSLVFSTTGVLPTGMLPATPYTVVNSTDNTFELSGVITTAAGSGVHSYAIQPSANVLVQTTSDGFCTDASSAGSSGLAVSVVTQGVGEDPTTNQVLLSQSLSPSIAIEETAKSLVRVINRSTTSNIYAYYTSGIDQTPGKIFFEGKSLSDSPFYLLADSTIIGESFTPDLSPDYVVSSVQGGPFDVTISFASPAVFQTTAAHGLLVNDAITLSTTGSLPSPLSASTVYYVRNILSPTQFTISATIGGLEINTMSPGSGTHSYIEVSNIFTPITYSAPNTIFDLNFPCPYSVGDKVVIADTNTTPSIDGVYTIKNVSGNTFIVDAPANSGGTRFSIRLASDSEFSSNEEQKHRIYYSKTNQPEAVPILNYFDVGASDKAILRIFPLRDSLFVFKEDGLFRVSGETPPFVQALFDSSCIAIAPDSLGVSNNLIYLWTTQGISAVSEAGVSIASRPIDTEILEIASSRYTNFKNATFGVGYDSDNSYIVWTVTKDTDSVATQAYRYSNLTSTWTKYDQSKTCGVVNPVDDRLYLGASDVAYIEQERKLFNRTDYADREFIDVIGSGSYANGTLKLSSTIGLSIGDVVLQEQFVTIYDFNGLLKKLDSDPGIIPLITPDYFYTNFKVSKGDNLRTKLVALANALDALNLGFNNYVSSINTYNGLIVGISAANPTIVSTSSNHNLFTGRIVDIFGTNSTRNINGTFEVTKIDNDEFSIPLSVSVQGNTGSWITDDQDFRDIKACYNKIIDLLNADTVVAYSNYQQIDHSSLQESVIINVDNVFKKLTLSNNLDYVQGNIKIFKAIPTSFTYAPATLGDPLSLKHLREATMMFINKQFTVAKVSFSTDLLPGFISVDFNGNGPGLFGGDPFGENFFGGVSHSAPFRTYIPRQCQRCRYINIKFDHSVAREKYSILGITITGNAAVSTRAYR